MRRPQRNINGLVFTKQFDITVDSDFCRSRDHHPVFRAVMVHLYRQAFARFHGDAFHLVAVARVDRVIFAPRTIHFAMHPMLMATIGFDLLDHFFHILHRVTVGNQHRIFGLHYHQIFHPDGGDQARFGVHIAVFSFVINHIAVANVALGGVGADLP